jgi:hypothetical protein
MPEPTPDLLLAVLAAAADAAGSAPRDAAGALTPEGAARVDAVLALLDDPDALAALLSS